MISNISKWYMRLLLALASGFFWLHLIISFFSYHYFFRAPEGFLYIQFELFLQVTRDVYAYPANQDIFLGLLGGFFLLMAVVPALWPRIFIWPVVALNLFIFLGNIDLIWRNIEPSLLFWEKAYGPDYKYIWVAERSLFVFFSGVFTILLMPSAVRLVKKTGWYIRRSDI